MARSRNNIKARKQRQLAKTFADRFNSHDLSTINEYHNEQRSIQVNGERYGNKRKYMAATKVLERRAERKRLNRQNPEE